MIQIHVSMVALAVGGALLATSGTVPGQSCPVVPPNGPELLQAIKSAMNSCSAQEVADAIDEAKVAIGTCVGWPEDTIPRGFAPDTPASEGTVRQTWSGHYMAALGAYDPSCPGHGREEAKVAWAIALSALAGETVNWAFLADIASNIEATQYSEKYVMTPPLLVYERGFYGYYAALPPAPPAQDPCVLTGIVGQAIQFLWAHGGLFIEPYYAGRWAGRPFVVADYDFDGPFPDDGGGGYDHGWSGDMMVHVATVHPDLAVRKLAYESAHLAGQWAIAEPPVVNHNYTAKLVWLLADLYAISGRAEYRTAMLDKIRCNLIPGILVPEENDPNVVAGTNGIRFDQLHAIAQVPGRYWDYHNAMPQYHTMNAWALVAAYAALRDRGATAAAVWLRPYVFMLLDNLAREVNLLGSPLWPETPQCLLFGLWMIAGQEYVDPDQLTEWTEAAWRLWNSGNANAFPEGSSTAALYLLWAAEPYTPLAHRFGDVNGDGMTDFRDLVAYRANPVDLNDDGAADSKDEDLLLWWLQKDEPGPHKTRRRL